MVVFSKTINDEFEAHSAAVRQRARQRQEAVRLRATVDDTTAAAVVDIRDTLGVRLPEDKWEGCQNLRTLRTLLSIVDDRGFERCACLTTHCQHRTLLAVSLLANQVSPSNGISLRL